MSNIFCNFFHDCRYTRSIKFRYVKSGLSVPGADVVSHNPAQSIEKFNTLPGPHIRHPNFPFPKGIPSSQLEIGHVYLRSHRGFGMVFPPVSYTHLDVYKRQGITFSPVFTANRAPQYCCAQKQRITSNPFLFPYPTPQIYPKAIPHNSKCRIAPADFLAG